MQPLFVVDAFTDRPFAGNPAGVLVLEAERDLTWMQTVASELNLSETSFLRRQEDGVWSLRWFTPVLETALCGHATLAAAHVLWTEGHHPPDEPIRFSTVSGELRALTTGDGEIRLDFPATPPQPLSPPPDLEEIIPWPHRFVGRAEPTKNYLVEVDSPVALRSLQPNLARLVALPAGGLIVTVASDDPAYDFLSRYFAPAAGIPEDPVTGSAHCTLGPYWQVKLGKSRFRALQVSPRTGALSVEVRENRVHLGGSAVTTIRGSLVAGM
ncbi:MAG: PhzF family phenazine biosynthesis protein [Actinomycetota bacterium]|nr:PhzF family phenazine biosynthesis protein [Actinomycetota bacterium]